MLKESLINQGVTSFFGLTESEINDLIDQLEFDRGKISPMFLSPGYGGNNSLKPKILMTWLSSRPDTYQHEARHGLHFKVCCAIFERVETSLDAFRLFCENVLGDKDFIKLIENKGSDFQRSFVSEARVLLQQLQIEGQILPEDVSKLAVKLGALTYQHAYFVDPRMAEAVASYGDTGVTKIVGLVNRVTASVIPYHDNLALKGYGDKKSQSMFENANIFQKALLIKKADYNRDVFFGFKQ